MQYSIFIGMLQYTVRATTRLAKYYHNCDILPVRVRKNKKSHEIERLFTYCTQILKD